MATRVIATLAACLAIAGLAGLLHLEPRFDPKDLLDLDADVQLESERIQALFGADQPTSIFVLRDENVLSLQSLQRIERLSQDAAALPGSAEVLSILNAPLPHRGQGDLDAILTLIESAPASFPGGLAALGERIGGELVVGPIVPAGASLDTERHEELLRVADLVHGQLVDATHQRALIMVRGDVSAEALRRLEAEHGVEATGLPLLQEHLEAQLITEGAWLIGVALGLTALLLAFFFRSATAVALPLTAAGVTVGVTMGGLGWSGYGLTLLTSIVPPVLLTVAVGDSLHLLFRFSEERRQHDAPEAARRTYEAMVRACFATTATTAIGFAALLVADTPAVRIFAATVTLGVALAFVVVVGLLPRMLSKSRWGGRTLRMPWTERVVRWSSSRRMGVLSGALVLCAASGWGVSELDHGTRLLAPFGQEQPMAQLAHELDADFGGVRQMSLALPQSLSAGDQQALEEWLRSQPEVRQLRSAQSVLDQMWARLADGPRPQATTTPLSAIAGPVVHSLQSPEYRLVEVTLADARADRMREIGEQARERGAALVGGEAWRAGVGLSALQADLAGSFGLAFVGIFALIAFLFGARLAIASVLPNLLPMACVVGWMGLRGMPLDVGAAMVFAVTLGLVVDGTLHILARLREHDGDLERAYQAAGPAVVVGGLVLLAGFSALFISDLQPLRQFAELAAIAIGSGLLCELVLLPALLPSKRSDERASDA